MLGWGWMREYIHDSGKTGRRGRGTSRGKSEFNETRKTPRWRCICNANIWPTLPEGRKNESVETGGNEIERPIALANPISNSSSSARSNHVFRRCAIFVKKNFPLLNYRGGILEISGTAIDFHGKLATQVFSILKSQHSIERCKRLSLLFMSPFYAVKIVLSAL